MRQGMQRSVENTLRLKEGGLLFAGLPCHSFIFLNLATSMRSEATPFGDEQKLYVRQSNAYLSDIINFICICFKFFLGIRIASTAQAGSPIADTMLFGIGSESALCYRATWDFNLYPFPIPEIHDGSSEGICEHWRGSLVGGSIDFYDHAIQ